MLNTFARFMSKRAATTPGLAWSKKRLKRLRQASPEDYATMRSIHDMKMFAVARDTRSAVELYRKILDPGAGEAAPTQPNGVDRAPDAPYDFSLVNIGREHHQTILGLASSDFSSEFLADATRAWERVEAMDGGASEGDFSSMIKILSCQGDTEGALRLLSNLHERGVRPKCRTYSPLLSALCQTVGVDDMARAVKCYEDMRNTLRDNTPHPLFPGESEFIEVLRMCVRLGSSCGASEDSAASANPDSAAAELRRAWDMVLSDYFESVQVPREEFHGIAREWFLQCPASAPQFEGKSADVDSTTVSGQTASPSASLKHADAVQRPGRWVMETNCAVNVATGLCAACGVQLRSLDLSEAKSATLLEQIAGLASEKARAPKKGKGGGGFDQFKHFVRWLEKRKQSHGLDCVVDAANVGYYKQNLTSGVERGGSSVAQRNQRIEFNYRQVDQMLRHLEKMGRRCMVVLHRRHLRDSILRNNKEANRLVQRWKDSDCLYLINPGHNDDWYWLYAAVWLGPNAYFVSNDEMRDHHFAMIGGRDFFRWKERHQAPYDVIQGRNSSITLYPPLPYSTSSQSSLDGLSWHFPISDADIACAEKVVVDSLEDSRKLHEQGAPPGSVFDSTEALERARKHAERGCKPLFKAGARVGTEAREYKWTCARWVFDETNDSNS